MKVYCWSDRQKHAGPRAVVQRGECDRGQCGQFSISISNGELGLTVRFDSESEFREFVARGEIALASTEESVASASSAEAIEA